MKSEIKMEVKSEESSEDEDEDEVRVWGWTSDAAVMAKKNINWSYFGAGYAMYCW